MTSTLTLDSWKVNVVNNYVLWIKPLASSGHIGVSLPEYIMNQLQTDTASYSISANGSVISVALLFSGSYGLIIPVSPTTANITITLTEIKNPQDSKPFDLFINQAVDHGFTKIYGKK